MQEDRIKKYRKRILRGKGTLFIILINMTVYLALTLLPDLRENLLLHREIGLILNKPWTLVTVFLSHEIPVHLLLNMILLFFFGWELEKNTNAKTIFLIYGLAGSMGSLSFPLVGIFFQREGISVGASAAVFGVVCAFAVLRPSSLVLFSKAKHWAGALSFVSIASLFIQPEFLDSAVAHLAGILTGVICGYYLKKGANEEEEFPGTF